MTNKHTELPWRAWQAARAQSGQEEDGKGSLPWFVHVYNSGYEAGHHDTVECGFTPIHHSDKDTYHEDVVMEILEDLNVRDSHPQPEGGGLDTILDRLANKAETENISVEVVFDDGYTREGFDTDISEHVADWLRSIKHPQPPQEGSGYE